MTSGLKKDFNVEDGYGSAGVDSVVVWLNPSPNPVASRARHEFVSPLETFASRIVVPCWEREALRSAGAASWSVVASHEIKVGRGWNAPLPWFWKDEEASLEFIASVFCGSSEKRL